MIGSGRANMRRTVLLTLAITIVLLLMILGQPLSEDGSAVAGGGKVTFTGHGRGHGVGVRAKRALRGRGAVHQQADPLPAASMGSREVHVQQRRREDHGPCGQRPAAATVRRPF